ncbi:MAG: glycosyltransferase family 2 protein, partial [Eggerthellaceae bacterium]
EVGVVGAKLLYYDGLVQHAGMLIGPDGTVVHVNQNVPDAQGCYLGRSVRPGNFSSVTGACQMVKRTVFEEVGGYSEEFAVGYNDADFCCKVSAAGYSVTFTPYAKLYHNEFVSRGREEGSSKMQRWLRERALMQEKWPQFFEQGDPFSNPNLDRDSLYFALPRRRTRAVNGRGSFAGLRTVSPTRYVFDARNSSTSRQARSASFFCSSMRRFVSLSRKNRKSSASSHSRWRTWS